MIKLIPLVLGRFIIRVYDTKNEYSFLLHMPGTDKHKRSENPVMGETIQMYDFSIPLEEVKTRATGSN